MCVSLLSVDSSRERLRGFWLDLRSLVRSILLSGSPEKNHAYVLDGIQSSTS